MKKILISILIIPLLLYVIFATIFLLIDYEGIYQKFYKKISETGWEVRAQSIEVARFPFPRVELGNVSTGGSITAKKLQIKFSLLSLLTLKPKISEIHASGVGIYSTKDKLDFACHASVLMELYRVMPMLPPITLEDITLVDTLDKSNEHVNSVILGPESNVRQLSVNWNKNTNTTITFQAGAEGINLHINSKGPSYSANLSETYKDGKLKVGALRYSIDNLKEFIAKRYEGVDLLITKIHSTQPAELNCRIEAEGDKIQLADIKLNSKSVSMTGNIDILGGVKIDSADLSFDFIDFKTLLASPNMDIVNESRQKNQFVLENTPRSIKIRVKKAILADAELTNVAFDSGYDGNKLNVNKFSGDISGGGGFGVSGALTQNQYRSMFEGNLDLRHPDFNFVLSKFGYANLAAKEPANFMLQAAIKATPIDYALNDLFMKIGQVNIDGVASIKFIGATPRANITLNLSSLDLLSENNPILSKMVAYTRNITTDMQSKDYLKKFIPIRELNYIGNFDISFSDLVVKEQEIDKLRIISEVVPGSIIVNSAYYQDQSNYLTGSGFLFAAGIKPEVGIKIAEASIEIPNTSVSDVLKFIQSMNNEYDLNKVNINAEISINKLKNNDTLFENIIFNATNNGILWNISNLQCKYLDGQFSSSGSLRTDSTTLNLSYAYNDFSVHDIKSFLPLSMFGIEEGWASSNGMISSSGSTLDQFFYNLYIKSKLAITKLSWINFDIDGFAQEFSAPKYQSPRLQQDAEHYLNSGLTIINSLASEVEVNHGVFKVKNAKFETNRIKGKSDASYNIYDNKISVETVFSFQPPIITVYSTPRPVEFNMTVTGEYQNTKKSFVLDNLQKYIDNIAIFRQDSAEPYIETGR